MNGLYDCSYWHSIGVKKAHVFYSKTKTSKDTLGYRLSTTKNWLGAPTNWRKSDIQYTGNWPSEVKDKSTIGALQYPWSSVRFNAGRHFSRIDNNRGVSHHATKEKTVILLCYLSCTNAWSIVSWTFQTSFFVENEKPFSQSMIDEGPPCQMSWDKYCIITHRIEEFPPLSYMYRSGINIICPQAIRERLGTLLNHLGTTSLLPPRLFEGFDRFLKGVSMYCNHKA